MMRIIAAALLVACVAAETDKFWSLQNRLETVQATLSGYNPAYDAQTWSKALEKAQADADKMISDYRKTVEDRAARVFDNSLSAIATTVSTTTSAMANNIDARVERMNARIAATKAETLAIVDQQVNLQKLKLEKDLQALESSYNRDLGTLGSELDSSSKTVLARISSTQTEITSTITESSRQVDTRLKPVIDASKKATEDGLKALQKAAYPPRIIWSGGCSGHGHSDGWKPYCVDRTDFNTAGDYVVATGGNGNSQFRTLQAGYYRVNWWSRSDRYWNHAGLWLNNRHIHHGHHHGQNHNWQDNFLDITWKFNRGDVFWVQIYGTGWNYWNYISWNSGGAHSRLQIEYVGAL